MKNPSEKYQDLCGLDDVERQTTAAFLFEGQWWPKSQSRCVGERVQVTNWIAGQKAREQEQPPHSAEAADPFGGEFV